MTQAKTPNTVKLARKLVKGAALLGFSGMCFTFFTLFFIMSGDAYANATSDAQQSLNKAYNDYYAALKTGPAKTPAEQTKLREQIIGPAEVALNRAIQKDAASFDPNKAAQNGSAAAGANSSYRSNSRVNAGDSGAPAPAATAETPSNSAPIEATAPREIEFPGPLALPAASPSPAKKRAH